MFVKCIHAKQFYLFDLLSLLPTDVLYVFLNKHDFWPVIRINRLLKLTRVLELKVKIETSTNNPYLFRIFSLLSTIALIIHWNACIFHLVKVYAQIFQGEHVSFANPMYNFIPQYANCFYRSTLQLTTISNVPSPTTTFEKCYMITNYLIGLLIFAIVVGSVTDIIDDLNMKRSVFQKRVDAVKMYMESRNVNRKLQERVIKWFDNAWTSTKGLDERLIFQEFLPSNLQAEIAMNIHMQSLQRVHIFQDCEPGLLQQLVTKLKLQVFSPGDFVCKKGDIGKEMYFIKSGRLAVVSDDGSKVFVNLVEGSYFGEISILDIPGNKTGNRRTANVKSVGFSYLFCLTKVDLWQALAEYPLAKTTLLEKGKALLRKDNLLDEAIASEIEELDKNNQNAEAKMNMMRHNLNLINKRLDQITKTYKNGFSLLTNKVENFQ